MSPGRTGVQRAEAMRPFVVWANMKNGIHFLVLAVALAQLPTEKKAVAMSKPQGSTEWDAYVYERAGGQELKLYVFEPAHSEYGKTQAAVLIFHGGGWVEGKAEWTFGQARYFSSLGMVGIAVDYRLSNGKDVTPFEAAEDAKAAVRWVRTNAVILNVNPKKIAAYGESAGGQLAATTAIVSESPTKEELNAVPNALVLVSPALYVENSEGFRRMAGAGRNLKSVSPPDQVRKEMPPTIIVTGALDKSVPPELMNEYCKKLKQAQNRCELTVYPGVGHMLTAPEDGPPNVELETKTRYAAYLRIDQFLISLKFVEVNDAKH